MSVIPSPGSLWFWNPKTKLAPITAVELSAALVASTDLVHLSWRSPGVGRVVICVSPAVIRGKQLIPKCLKFSEYIVNGFDVPQIETRIPFELWEG